jgi:LytS/YehU family sensor histidine kinase
LLRVFEFEQERALNFLRYEFFVLSFTLIIVYLNLRVLIPKFWNGKEYIRYGLFVTLALLFCVTLISLIFLAEPEYFKPPFGRRLGTGKIAAIHFARMFLFLSITSLIHFMKEWIKLKDDNLKLKEKMQEKLEAELKLLKGQVNPHFLFNTLNNIYSMSLYDSAKTPEMILKLSQLISYMLYECKDELVPLEKEIRFIENYIELEAIRVEDIASVEFKLLGQDPGHMIPPLLFIPLVENAFKHGIPSNGKHAEIKIQMDVNPDSLSLKIQNPQEEKEDETPSNTLGGLGIQNVKKRLELLFPNKHCMKINSENGIHSTQLKLEL